jgi:hypothetical protein
MLAEQSATVLQRVRQSCGRMCSDNLAVASGSCRTTSGLIVTLGYSLIVTLGYCLTFLLQCCPLVQRAMLDCLF